MNTKYTLDENCGTSGRAADLAQPVGADDRGARQPVLLQPRSTNVRVNVADCERTGVLAGTSR